MLHITDYTLPPARRAGRPIADHMDGVIVALVHDEFLGMGLEDLREFMEEGAVMVGVMEWRGEWV